MLAPGSVGRIFENLDEIEAIRYRLRTKPLPGAGTDRVGFLMDGMDRMDLMDAARAMPFKGRP